MTMVLLPDRIIDALSLTLNNILGLFGGMLIAILVLGVGPRYTLRHKLTWKRVYQMIAIIAVLLLVILLILIMTHHNY